jgi:hypothetical protein
MHIPCILLEPGSFVEMREGVRKEVCGRIHDTPMNPSRLSELLLVEYAIKLECEKRVKNNCAL